MGRKEKESKENKSHGRGKEGEIIGYGGGKNRVKDEGKGGEKGVERGRERCRKEGKLRKTKVTEEVRKGKE